MREEDCRKVECELCHEPVGENPVCLECYNAQAGAWEESQKQIAEFQENEKSLKAQLAEARAENARLASQLKEWQDEKDAKAGYL